MATTTAEAKIGETGNDLYQSCKQFVAAEEGPKDVLEAMDEGVCYATVRTIFFFHQNLGLCFPQRATLGQLIKVTLKFMDNNPKHLDMPFTAIAFLALNEAFPCHKQQ